MRFCYVVNNPDFLISHRLEICKEALSRGYEVHIVCPEKHSVIKLKNLGFIVHFIDFGRDRKNPLIEFYTVYLLTKLFKKINPRLVHLITIKPYLYGGIAARLANVPCVVSAVAGLGILFSSDSIKYRMLRMSLYPIFKLSFGHKCQTVIFQNLYDMSLMVNFKIVSNKIATLIRGSGVNLNDYRYVEEQLGLPVVSFAARLLKDKGVEVFVESARILKKIGVNARFLIIGEPDLGNKNSISLMQLESWRNEGIVELLGYRDDIPKLFSESNIIAFPSFYGEGLPRVLIEAAACGRTIVTTDHPGCRDAIVHGVTGLLVPVRDAFALAGAIEYLIKNSEKRLSMGIAGRLHAESEFSIEKVVELHFKVYGELISKVSK